MTSIAKLEIEPRVYRLTTKEGWLERVTAPLRPVPPELSRAQLDRLDTTARARFDEARKIWHANIGPIATPQMEQITAELEEIVDANRQDGDKVKPAAVIDAWPGLGKTTLVTRFATQFHREQIALRGEFTSAGHQRLPVAYLSLGSNTSMRSLNSMLCTFYGHPGAHTGNAQRLADRATTCVQACETRLIVIDDVHFLDLHRRNDREVANHFKWLATQFPVTFIFVGVGIESRGLLSEGLSVQHVGLSQTARRWTPLGLEPFELRTKQGRRDWRALLLAIERDVRLVDKSKGMLADELAEYVYARSTGHFQSLMSLIQRGCVRAMRTGEERLTAELLDSVKIDAAAERSRSELEAAIASRHLRSAHPASGHK